MAIIDKRTFRDIMRHSTNSYRATFERKKDADAYHATVNFEVASGTHTPTSKSKTVAEAGQLWLKTGEANGLERATLDSYQQHLDLHITPYLGTRKLSELTTPMIRDFEDRLRAGKPAPGQEQAEPRSSPMVKRIVVSLGSLLADAQERGFVAQNVVRNLRSSRKGGKARRAERRQRGRIKVGVDIPSPTEIKAIIAHLQGRWRPLLLTAIFTGLRASELRGLRWEDVDLTKSKLHVRQRADKYKEIGKPKSEAGEREVPLPPLVVNALREWKLRCPRGKEGLVFPTGTGAVEHHANIVHRGWGPAQIAAGVVNADGTAKYTGLHALLCILVHQPQRGRRAGTADQSGARAAWAFDDQPNG
jgi:integrase